jgi:hypothetical protein
LSISRTPADNTAANLPSNGANPPDLGGTTIFPGVYNSVFVFPIGSTLTTASNSAVVPINGASAANVYWQAGSSATLGTGTSFAGNIHAQASISLGTGPLPARPCVGANGCGYPAGQRDLRSIAGCSCSDADPNPHANSDANSDTDPLFPRSGVDRICFSLSFIRPGRRLKKPS